MSGYEKKSLRDIFPKPRLSCHYEMSLRDYFAAQAMCGLVSSFGQHDVVAPDEVASDAYGIADAMIEKGEARNG